MATKKKVIEKEDIVIKAAGMVKSGGANPTGEASGGAMIHGGWSVDKDMAIQLKFVQIVDADDGTPIAAGFIPYVYYKGHVISADDMGFDDYGDEKVIDFSLSLGE